MHDPGLDHLYLGSNMGLGRVRRIHPRLGNAANFGLHRVGALTAAAFALVLAPTATYGQSTKTIRIGGEPSCASCRVVLHPRLTLGENEPPADIANSGHIGGAADVGYFVFNQFDPGKIRYFDR